MTLVASNLDFNNAARIINLQAPVAATEPVRLQDLTSALEGLAWKDSVRVAAQTNLNLTSPGATIDGITMVLNDRILLLAQTAPAENGVYIWNGAAVGLTRAVDCSTANDLESATTLVEEGTSTGTSYRQTSVNFVLGTGAVVWTQFGTNAPASSATTAGLIRTATQAEVDAGTVTNAAVTPATLSTYAARIKKYATTIGDGTATSYAVTHNLNSLDVQITVYRISDGAEVIVDRNRTSVNVATIVFAAAPAANTYRVVVVG